MHAAGALAVDQPHGRAGLLGLADSTVVRRALGRHRLRCRHPPAGDDEQLRARTRLAASASAAGCRPRRSASRAVARFRLPAPVFLRLPAGVLGRTLGADRRGRRVPRSVLFARQRFHRDLEHLHLRADRARPRGALDRPVRRAVPATVLLVLRQHDDAVPGPVPVVRQCRGAADQGAVGLHLLLGRAVPARVPAAADRSCAAR